MCRYVSSIINNIHSHRYSIYVCRHKNLQRFVVFSYRTAYFCDRLVLCLYGYKTINVGVGMNIITFGKYKGMPVTRVLRIDPSYFGWCKNNVSWFKFSKRDYEIYLEWLSLQQNHLQFTGYSDDMGIIRFLFRKVEEGKFNSYSDTEYLTKETCGEYLKSTKEHYFIKHV